MYVNNFFYRKIHKLTPHSRIQHDNNALDQSTLSTITAATNIGGDISVLVAGSGCQRVADEVASVAGVSKVLIADNEAYVVFECGVLFRYPVTFSRHSSREYHSN